MARLRAQQSGRSDEDVENLASPVTRVHSDALGTLLPRSNGKIELISSTSLGATFKFDDLNFLGKTFWADTLSKISLHRR